jgi:hypothetical protein
VVTGAGAANAGDAKSSASEKRASDVNNELDEATGLISGMLAALVELKLAAVFSGWVASGESPDMAC